MGNRFKLRPMRNSCSCAAVTDLDLGRRRLLAAFGQARGEYVALVSRHEFGEGARCHANFVVFTTAAQAVRHLVARAGALLRLKRRLGRRHFKSLTRSCRAAVDLVGEAADRWLVLVGMTVAAS